MPSADNKKDNIELAGHCAITLSRCLTSTVAYDKDST